MFFWKYFKDNCSEDFVIFAENYLWESLLKEVTGCRVSIFFWTICSAKYDFIEIYEIFCVTNGTNFGC